PRILANAATLIRRGTYETVIQTPVPYARPGGLPRRHAAERRAVRGGSMSKRTTRALTAQQTLIILKEGSYLHPSGARTLLRDELASACSRSVLYAPGDFRRVFQQRDELLRDRPPTPVAFEVGNETTLHAARRLDEAEPGTRVLALNFA